MPTKRKGPSIRPVNQKELALHGVVSKETIFSPLENASKPRYPSRLDIEAPPPFLDEDRERTNTSRRIRKMMRNTLYFLNESNGLQSEDPYEFKSYIQFVKGNGCLQPKAVQSTSFNPESDLKAGECIFATPKSMYPKELMPQQKMKRKRVEVDVFDEAMIEEEAKKDAADEGDVIEDEVEDNEETFDGDDYTQSYYFDGDVGVDDDGAFEEED